MGKNKRIGKLISFLIDLHPDKKKHIVGDCVLVNPRLPNEDIAYIREKLYFDVFNEGNKAMKEKKYRFPKDFIATEDNRFPSKLDEYWVYHKDTRVTKIYLKTPE